MNCCRIVIGRSQRARVAAFAPGTPGTLWGSAAVGVRLPSNVVTGASGPMGMSGPLSEMDFLRCAGRTGGATGSGSAGGLAVACRRGASLLSGTFAAMARAGWARRGADSRGGSGGAAERAVICIRICRRLVSSCTFFTADATALMPQMIMMITKGISFVITWSVSVASEGAKGAMIRLLSLFCGDARKT